MNWTKVLCLFVILLVIFDRLLHVAVGFNSTSKIGYGFISDPRAAIWNAAREVMQAVAAIFAAIAAVGWSEFKKWVVSKWQKNSEGEHQQDDNQPDDHKRRWPRRRRRRL